MIFTINRTTTWAAIIAITLKFIIAAIPFSTSQEFPDYIYLTNGIFENLLIIFILFYLKKFTNKVSGLKNLDMPLIIWMILVTFSMFLDVYKYLIGVNEIIKVSTALSGLYLLQTIYLIIKLFSTPNLPYKSYLNWFAFVIIIRLFISMPLPFLTGILADGGYMNFENGMYVIQININILHQLPYVVTLLLCLKYLKDSDKKSLVID